MTDSMLSKLSQTLKSLVTRETEDGLRRPSKRSRSSFDSEDEDFAPAKKSRFAFPEAGEPTKGSSGSWLPFAKLAELFVRGKQSIGGSSLVRTLSKIGSMSSSNQGTDASKEDEAGAGQNPMLPPPYATAGRGLYGTGADGAAPRVGYVDMPGFYMTPPAPIPLGFDPSFKMPLPRPGIGSHRPMPAPPPQQQQQQASQFNPAARFNGAAHVRRPYESVYEKTYPAGASGTAAWIANRSHSVNGAGGAAKSRMAAKESVRLEERDRYRQLLQNFTSFRRLDETLRRPARKEESPKDRSNETVLGSRVERSSSCDSSRSSKASSDVQIIHVEPSKTRAQATTSATPGLTHRSFQEQRSLRRSPREISKSTTESRLHNGTDVKASSLRTGHDFFTPASSRWCTAEDRHRTPAQPEFESGDCEIVEEVKPVQLSLRSPSAARFNSACRDSPFVDEKWIQDLHTKFSTDERRRSIVDAEVTVAYMREKRDDIEELLQARLKKRLSLHEKSPAVLEEKFDDEEAAAEFPELTEEMQERIDNALHGRCDGAVLSEAFRLQITRKDLQTLDGLNWLNDEVMNFYMELLKERGSQDNFPTVHAFNTFFYPKIMSGGHAAVKRWTRRVDVFAVDYILVPIHLGMHWCLAVVDFIKKQIRYYDSMGGTNTACLAGLRDYLVAESMDKRKKPFDMSDWSMEIVKGIPQQMNGSDCGVFACKYAEYVSRGADITFSQENMPYFRRRMVYEILTKQLL